VGRSPPEDEVFENFDGEKSVKYTIIYSTLTLKNYGPANAPLKYATAWCLLINILVFVSGKSGPALAGTENRLVV